MSLCQEFEVFGYLEESSFSKKVLSFVFVVV